MIARADVFLQNLAPGAAAKLGFGSGALRERHSRLITCDISGYGEGGPYETMKAYDLLVQAESGVAAITGSPDEPARVGVSVADFSAGVHAYGAIVEALFAREKTGDGRAISVSLFHTLADWMNVPLFHNDLADAGYARVGLRHPTIAPYGLFRCAGGEPLVIAIQNAREWVRLCEAVLDRPDMTDDPRFADNAARIANRPALEAEMGAVFGALSREGGDRPAGGGEDCLGAGQQRRRPFGPSRTAARASRDAERPGADGPARRAGPRTGGPRSSAPSRPSTSMARRSGRSLLRTEWAADRPGRRHIASPLMNRPIPAQKSNARIRLR